MKKTRENRETITGREALGLRVIVTSEELASFLYRMIVDDLYNLNDGQIEEYVWKRARHLHNEIGIGTIANVLSKVKEHPEKKKEILVELYKLGAKAPN